MQKATFRKDINGLRAVAVIAVILYHFGVSGFGGGFVGVDVFFVISGYLMTEIITSKIKHEKFSLFEFYLARAKRIFPALVALCTVLLILGWFFLPAAELKELGKQVKSSVLFFSNHQFMKDSGYFDSASHEKFLLHTWSLSVEWQFYLLYPILIMAVSKFSKRQSTLVGAITLLALTSYLASSLIAESRAAINFYSIGTRAWEMAAGGLVYLLPSKTLQKKARYALGLLGLAAVVLSSIFLTESGVWPGALTLAPVLGCAIVIWAAGNFWLLENRLMQLCGKISYSLYLWHWPIVVSLVFFQVQEEPRWIVVGIILTVALGAASYHAFERTPQNYLRQNTAFKNTALLAIAILCIANAGQLFKKKSFPDRLNTDTTLTEQEALNSNPRRDECMLGQGVESPACNYGGEGDIAAIVWGDSHANSVVTAVEAALPDKSLKVQEWSYASCPTIFKLNLVVNDRQCREFNDWAFEKLKNLDAKIPVIIVNRSSSYPLGDEGGPTLPKDSPYIYFSKPYKHPVPAFLQEYSDNYVSTICKISKTRKVYLVRPFPEMSFNVPKYLARRLTVNSNAEISITMDAYKKRHAFVYQTQDAAANECGVTILDPVPYLCHDDRCSGSESGRPFYYDASHLSEFGNRRLIPMFQTML
ncbi:acyltransferase [Pseudomonas sp. P115]|uniref:acyltransferase family protein n=1 Tax=Pseudomonas pisciculturae TaxID=2730413 RepID=UPI0018921097|nr:acyltransferase family protein [Pseudomonas pisciculturae]MBF6026586.1 acyltransferase [Pseudomonas pisciculturae]